ncbi:lipid kinase YegS [Halomonas sp. ML-15]|uniref:lipid kinase YegS n=1 Tax=Halomonas sp. ML-15 TaxID=2773305 RepID=UPI0017460E25|nr:lipid kinase YegS [Halomonas sp. ML-15]MBD3895919.1 lipid kinase YegS [Halomonas sp. ML-15]
MTDDTARVILNGKSAQLPEVREAVQALREAGADLEVRVTWEAGDALRLCDEASRDGITRLIAGGGDGTVNELVNGLMRLAPAARPALGVLPLGSANDFANGAGIPLEPRQALALALEASPHKADVVRLGNHYYLNMASCGFGAAVTSSTPKAMKRLLGGGAYSLMGALEAWRYQPYRGHMSWPEGESDAPLFLLAIGNGCQAGGGQRLAPSAKLDDGLLEVLIVRDFESLSGLKQALDELEALPACGEYVEYFQTTRLRFDSDAVLPLTLDGEPFGWTHFEANVLPGELTLLLPAKSPLLS